MIRFRDATGNDLVSIVALLMDDDLGTGREEAGPPLPDAYATGFRRMTAQGGRIILMLEGDEIIGCLQLNILYGVSGRGKVRAQIEAVRISGARRGRGLGAALIGHAIAEARAAECGLVQLTTNLTRADAHRFYLKLGFVQSHAGMKLAL